MDKEVQVDVCLLKWLLYVLVVVLWLLCVLVVVLWLLCVLLLYVLVVVCSGCYMFWLLYVLVVVWWSHSSTHGLSRIACRHRREAGWSCE